MAWSQLSDGAEVMSAWGALGGDFRFFQSLALRALELARQLPELRFDGAGLKLLGVIFFLRLAGALEMLGAMLSEARPEALPCVPRTKFFDESRRLLVASAASLDEPLPRASGSPLVLDWADRVGSRGSHGDAVLRWWSES